MKYCLLSSVIYNFCLKFNVFKQIHLFKLLLPIFHIYFQVCIYCTFLPISQMALSDIGSILPHWNITNISTGVSMLSHGLPVCEHGTRWSIDTQLITTIHNVSSGMRYTNQIEWVLGYIHIPSQGQICGIYIAHEMIHNETSTSAASVIQSALIISVYVCIVPRQFRLCFVLLVQTLGHVYMECDWKYHYLTYISQCSYHRV